MTKDGWVTVEDAKAKLRRHFWTRFMIRQLFPWLIISLAIALIIVSEVSFGVFFAVWMSGPVAGTAFWYFAVWPSERRWIDREVASYAQPMED